MPNTRVSGIFETTVFAITRLAQRGDATQYDVAVAVNGSNHVVVVEIRERFPGGYFGAGGFQEAFPYSANALGVIGSWVDRVHKGESVEFPVHLVI